MKFPTIAGKKILLRPFEISDASVVSQILEDKWIYQTTLNIPYPYPVNGALEWIASHHLRFLQNTDIVFAIEETSSQRLAGCISLAIDGRHQKGELGYWVAKELRNKGYASEAISLLLHYADRVKHLHRIEARYFVWNEASRKILLKNGFQIEGVFKEAIKKDGKFENLEWAAKLF